MLLFSKQNVLVSVLVLSLLAPAGVYANEPVPPKHPERHKVHMQEHKARLFHGKMCAHKAMYFTLLAEKYTPESVAEWKAVFAERKRLAEELKSLRSQHDNKVTDNRRALWKDGRKQTEAERAERKQLFEQFTKAIEQQDESAIKQLLPKMLAETKKQNERMAEKLDVIKKGLTKTGME